MNALIRVIPTALLVLSTGLAHAEPVTSGSLLVSLERDDAVVVLDATSLATKARIATGKRPRGMGFSADRTLVYVACSNDNRIDVISLAEGKVVRRYEGIDNPEMFSVSPDGKSLWLSNEDAGEASRLNLETGVLDRVVPTGEEPEGMLVSSDGKTLYVTSEVANRIHVIDIASGEERGTVVVGNRPRRMVLAQKDTELWVTNELAGTVSIVSTATLQVTDEIRFEPRGFRPEDITPVGLALSPDGKTAFVSLGRANHVARVDVASRAIGGYVLTGQRAWGLAVSADGETLYVANGLSDDVAAVSVADWKVRTAAGVGRVPHSILVVE